MEQPTHFLNVDLELESPTEMSPLIDALARRAFVLQHDSSGTTHRATIELNREPRDPDAALEAFGKLVRALPLSAREAWNQAAVRDFNIGVQAGTTPPHFELTLAPGALAVASELRARIVLTVYGSSEQVFEERGENP